MTTPSTAVAASTAPASTATMMRTAAPSTIPATTSSTTPAPKVANGNHGSNTSGRCAGLSFAPRTIRVHTVSRAGSVNQRAVRSSHELG